MTAMAALRRLDPDDACSARKAHPCIRCVFRVTAPNTMTDEAPVDLIRRGSDRLAEVEDYADLPAAKSLPCKEIRVHIGIIRRSA
jgi:hypothetical protein